MGVLWALLFLMIYKVLTLEKDYIEYDPFEILQLDPVSKCSVLFSTDSVLGFPHVWSLCSFWDIITKVDLLLQKLSCWVATSCNTLAVLIVACRSSICF